MFKTPAKRTKKGDKLVWGFLQDSSQASFSGTLDSESQLLEEPLVLADVVPLFQLLFDFCACSGTFATVFQDILVDDGLVQCYINTVTRGHQMIVVDNFQKGFDFRSFCDFLLAHGFGDFSRVFIDTSNQGVAVGPVLGSVVVVFDDDGFAAGIFASQQKNNFA